METAQVETPEIVEAPEEEVDYPDWMVDNILYQARERYLEEESIPEKNARRSSALGVYKDKLSKIREKLKENTKARHEATEKGSTKKVLVEISFNELELLSQKATLEQERDKKDEDLGIKPEIDDDKDSLGAVKWKRYKELGENVPGFYTMGSQPIDGEEELVQEYKAARRVERAQIRAALRKR